MTLFSQSGKRSDAFRKLVDTIALALCKLNQIQFESPWNPRQRGC